MNIPLFNDLINKFFLSTYGINKWRENEVFQFNDRNVPSEMNGYETFSDQFQFVSSDLQKCFTSELDIIKNENLVSVSCTIIQVRLVDYILNNMEYEVARFGKIKIVFNTETDNIQDSCFIDLYDQDGTETEIDLPSIDIDDYFINQTGLRKWGVSFKNHIRIELSKEWWSLGFVISEIIQLINLAFLNFNNVETDNNILHYNFSKSVKMLTALSVFNKFIPDGVNGYTSLVKMESSDTQARIYLPRIVAKTNNWEMLVKVDCFESIVKEEEYLFIHVKGDYSGKIIKTATVWKLYDESPEENLFIFENFSDAEEHIQNLMKKLDKRIIQKGHFECINWFLSEHLIPWLNIIKSMG